MQAIAMTPVVSSQIAARGYDEASQTLRIQFSPRRDGSPGSTYEYKNVDPETYKAFESAESAGSFFHSNIKPFPDKFPFARLEAETAED